MCEIIDILRFNGSNQLFHPNASKFRRTTQSVARNRNDALEGVPSNQNSNPKAKRFPMKIEKKVKVNES